ncbi:MAG: MOSC domain-containing protein [Cyclobacteriaceae bacterium]
MSEAIIKKMINTLPQKGTVEWIGLRPASKAPMNIVESVLAAKSEGLIGDRFKGKISTKRQVTLIQAEHIETVRSVMKMKNLPPELLRRNIVVSGINLLALKDKRFTIGKAILETTGECHPCSRMEKTLGDGGYNAMRGHGGITARVLSEGEIRIGDDVYFNDSFQL